MGFRLVAQQKGKHLIMAFIALALILAGIAVYFSANTALGVLLAVVGTLVAATAVWRHR